MWPACELTARSARAGAAIVELISGAIVSISEDVEAVSCDRTSREPPEHTRRFSLFLGHGSRGPRLGFGRVFGSNTAAAVALSRLLADAGIALGSSGGPPFRP